jgi:hypothetical protein
VELHGAPVNGVEWGSIQDMVATGCADGSICITPLAALHDSSAKEQHTVLRAASSCASVAGLCWMGASTLVTVGSEGRVLAWDIRQINRESTPKSWYGKAQRRPQFLDVVGLLACPHQVVAAEQGGLSMWDLRNSQTPVWELSDLGDNNGGMLWKGVALQVDAGRTGSVAMPVVASSGTGKIVEVDAGIEAGKMRCLAEESGAAMVALDVDPVATHMVFACTDCASMTIIDRAQRK